MKSVTIAVHPKDFIATSGENLCKMLNGGPQGRAGGAIVFSIY